MAESLFDNRYRYDYIYPRGRSGETLRAVDTFENNRKVVIKRPAPNDAPPIRAGQEVSIVNERRALQRLTGHPVLTELLDDGQFFVGGMAHRYIVMERAEGIIVGDEVLELHASGGERLPELEILVIADRLLDLLQQAHQQDIVYNDVDAKHLFWDRETYTLKVIDWGNAVFLEGDEVTPQGISRQTDVYQAGELLYFLVRGGRRAEVPRNADEDFLLDFGEDTDRIHSRLREIISKALHPNKRYRYPSIKALQDDLAAYREPIEQNRNEIVDNVAAVLQRGNLSKSELRTLRAQIEPALVQDPGYPAAVAAHVEIVDKLRDLSVEADLDAVHIYMQNGNWQRAAEVLRDLRDKAGTQTRNLIGLLLDICVILIDSSINPIPPRIYEAVEQLFENQTAEAAKTLLDEAPVDDDSALQWQLAERISSHIPEVLLLRPNLYRLTSALRQIATEGYSVAEVRSVLEQVDNSLDVIANGSIDLPSLRDGYRKVVDLLTTANPLLQTFAMQHELSNRRLPLSSLDRALNAAMALADSMHVIGRQATASPRDAQNALQLSRTIDPTNPLWDDLEDVLRRLYDFLQTCQTYVPSADGSDLEAWLENTRDKLRPYMNRLFDDMLVGMVRGVERAYEAWRTYQRVVIHGNKDAALTELDIASRSVNTISPALSTWFRQLRNVVEGANYAERHALPGGLGRALADGWQAFDRGKLTDAERLGQQANEIARTEAAHTAARRLQQLSKITREWVDRNGVNDEQRSADLLAAVERLLTPEETQLLREFETRMPSIDTYLKSMGKGLLNIYENVSTAALRLLFVYYIAQGALDAHEGRLDDGEFWIEAAVKTLPRAGRRHVALRELEEHIGRRRDLETAAAFFDRISGPEILPELETIRRRLENNVQSKLLASGIRSLRDLETALRHWDDADFRAAGTRIEQSIKALDDVEKTTGLSLEAYRQWLMALMQTAADLLVQVREMRAIVNRKPDQLDENLGRILRHLVDVTEEVLGAQYAPTLRQWRDTYEQFVEIYHADERRSRRLERLNEFFKAMFIDQHPAFPLFRHWYSVLEQQSEFAAPPTDNPTPHEEFDDIPEIEYRGSRYADEDDSKSRSGIPRLVIFGGIGGVVIVLLIIAGVVLSDNNKQQAGIEVTISPTSERTDDILAAADVTEDATELNLAAPGPTEEPEETVDPAETATAFSTPTIEPTSERIITLEPSETPVPTTTDTPTATPTIPTETPSPTLTPSMTPTAQPPSATPLPEGGLTGTQDLLNIFRRLDRDDLPFNPELFSPQEVGYRLGVGRQTPGDEIRIVPPERLLEDVFGNNATSRIRSMEAEILLLTINPAELEAEEATAFFGIAFESANDGNNVGLQIDIVSSNAINLVAINNNNRNFLRQRSVSSVIVRLRLDRDATNGDVSLFINDEPIGSRIPFIEAEEPVLPVIFVKDGGVVLSINSWRVILRR